MSVDEYDERDEQADVDPGNASARSHHLIALEQAQTCPRPTAGAADEQMNAAWSEEETVALVEVWAAADVQHSLKTSMRNGHVYADISEKLASLGYLRTAEQCQLRIKRLKKTYRRCCNNRRYRNQMGLLSGWIFFPLISKEFMIFFLGMEGAWRCFDTSTFSPRCLAMNLQM